MSKRLTNSTDDDKYKRLERAYKRMQYILNRLVSQNEKNEQEMYRMKTRMLRIIKLNKSQEF
jgi:hypothetical protein